MGDVPQLTRWWDVDHGLDVDERCTVTLTFPGFAPLVLSVADALTLATSLCEAANAESRRERFIGGPVDG